MDNTLWDFIKGVKTEFSSLHKVGEVWVRC